MFNIPQLRDDHFRLTATVRRLGALIERRKPPPPLHLATLRHELSSTLIAHLKDEDSLLYPQLLSSSDALIAATARTFSEDMGGLADAFQVHCETWTAANIASDWTGYCDDCRQILDALNIRIRRENRELFPLLEALAHTPDDCATRSEVPPAIGPIRSFAFPSSCGTAARNGPGSGRLLESA